MISSFFIYQKVNLIKHFVEILLTESEERSKMIKELDLSNYIFCLLS